MNVGYFNILLYSHESRVLHDGVVVVALPVGDVDEALDGAALVEHHLAQAQVAVANVT